MIYIYIYIFMNTLPCPERLRFLALFRSLFLAVLIQAGGYWGGGGVIELRIEPLLVRRVHTVPTYLLLRGLFTFVIICICPTNVATVTNYSQQHIDLTT